MINVDLVLVLSKHQHNLISEQRTMSFENAVVTKGMLPFLWQKLTLTIHNLGEGFMMTYALSSILTGIFDVKHYFHIQVSKVTNCICSLCNDMFSSSLRISRAITR